MNCPDGRPAGQPLRRRGALNLFIQPQAKSWPVTCYVPAKEFDQVVRPAGHPALLLTRFTAARPRVFGGLWMSLAQRKEQLEQQPGWSACLQLRFIQCEGVTRLGARRHFGPLLVQRPFHPEGAPCHVYILHPPGGIVAGDRLELDVHLEPGSHALLTMPGRASSTAASGLRHGSRSGSTWRRAARWNGCPRTASSSVAREPGSIAASRSSPVHGCWPGKPCAWGDRSWASASSRAHSTAACASNWQMTLGCRSGCASKPGVGQAWRLPAGRYVLRSARQSSAARARAPGTGGLGQSCWRHLAGALAGDPPARP